MDCVCVSDPVHQLHLQGRHDKRGVGEGRTRRTQACEISGPGVLHALHGLCVCVSSIVWINSICKAGMMGRMEEVALLSVKNLGPYLLHALDGLRARL